MIYKQHETAFKGVSAYVIASPTGERVATIAFKYAASGLRTICYMHWLGSPMVKGIASGGGYDKASAAAERARAEAVAARDRIAALEVAVAAAESAAAASAAPAVGLQDPSEAVRALKDLFPAYGDGFLLACLAAFDHR